MTLADPKESESKFKAWADQREDGCEFIERYKNLCTWYRVVSHWIMELHGNNILCGIPPRRALSSRLEWPLIALRLWPLLPLAS